MWQRPASWLSQGLGVHVAMEAWEQSGRTLTAEDLITIYRDEFTRSIEEQARETPNFEYWFGSGPYNGTQDIQRRWALGEKQLIALVDYCTNHPETKVWTTPDGKKAVELEFLVELGGVKVKGFIDQIIETPKGLVVRDIKTGATPGDTFQLATYAEAVRLMYDQTPYAGDYLMGKTGKPTKLYPITEEDRADVHKRFAELEQLLKEERFDPTPSRNTCAMCSVKTSCQFRAG